MLFRSSNNFRISHRTKFALTRIFCRRSIRPVDSSQAVMDEIEHAFKFNDAVLRHLTVVKKKAETGPSLMMRNVEREEARKTQQAEYAGNDR